MIRSIWHADHPLNKFKSKYAYFHVLAEDRFVQELKEDGEGIYGDAIVLKSNHLERKLKYWAVETAWKISPASLEFFCSEREIDFRTITEWGDRPWPSKKRSWSGNGNRNERPGVSPRQSWESSDLSGRQSWESSDLSGRQSWESSDLSGLESSFEALKRRVEDLEKDLAERRENELRRRFEHMMTREKKLKETLKQLIANAREGEESSQTIEKPQDKEMETEKPMGSRDEVESH